MSGGSYDYECYRVEEEYVGRMYDREMNLLMLDLVKVLHDLEWWQSGDCGEETYQKTLSEFKDKWFDGDRVERLQNIITEATDKLRMELLAMIGKDGESDDRTD